MERNLPSNWTETQLIDILESLENGSRPQGGVQGILTGIPSLGGEHLDYNGGFKLENVKYIPVEFANKLNRGLIKLNDILVVKDGATTGKTSFVDSNFPYERAFVNEHVFICRASKLLESKFVSYFLRSKEGQTRILENFTGSAQGGINQKFASNTLIPIAPLPEQTRIVAKLDALFAHLDTLKTKLDRIPELLKNFRQQVLTQAVTGKLTEEWRKGKELNEWENNLLIKLIVEKPRNGFSPKSVDFKTNVKSLTLSATTSGKFNPEFVKYLDIERPPLDSHLWLKNGDILIQRSNSLDYVGTSAIYDGEDNDFIYPDLMMKIRVNDKVLAKYLHYCLSSIEVRDYFKKNATGTAGNMPKINQETVIKTPINTPPLEEQHEIVRHVEELFRVSDIIEAHYKNLKEKIETLPKAILTKAYNGELVPQNQNDEPASVLLERIRKEKGGLE